jgi:hypothetical protein
VHQSLLEEMIVRTRSLIVGAGVLTALGSQPAVALAADTAPATDQATAKAAAAHVKAHRTHVKRTVHLARTASRLRGDHLRPGYGRTVSTWSNARLVRRQHQLRTEIRSLRVMRTKMNKIAMCESHGNPRAIGGGGAYRGKYQFDRQTWASVGGHGDPAAASEREQDKRAMKLYKRNPGAWPVCGR